MALDRDKFRGIVGGITTPSRPAPPEPSAEGGGPGPSPAAPDPVQGRGPAADEGHAPERPVPDKRRFAKTGRPKGRGTDAATKINKVKVSLFLDEQLVNELYEWAHQDRLHPGELFDRALRAFRDREVKRRIAGTP